MQVARTTAFVFFPVPDEHCTIFAFRCAAGLYVFFQAVQNYPKPFHFQHLLQGWHWWMEFLLKIEEIFLILVLAGIGMLGELLRPVSLHVQFCSLSLARKLEAMSVTLL